ncbi:hypothetical protein HLK59_34390 [Streptomyces sp. S3(2020)]|uniref:hypothetical protein n=1 Tax=Streptomyces sp. S3(2020) TaxID=2732044 RepID=UPI0014899947|nr:hypothetical protein [Streptomyces sp. S3(2020)]NNN35372.1 hypothetical protein [Streptomyces sp. S3(2020)]
MKMTETYAATVAAVAPVILLVAVVEINNRRQRVRELYELLAVPIRLIREMFRDGGDPTAQQVERVVQQVRETNVGARAGFGLMLYVLSAVAITTLLFLAELASLLWLAGTPEKSSSGVALFCALALGVGFAWVAYAPMVALLLPVSRNLLYILRGFKDYRRFLRLLRHYRAQGTVSTEPAPDSSGT